MFEMVHRQNGKKEDDRIGNFEWCLSRYECMTASSRRRDAGVTGMVRQAAARPDAFLSSPDRSPTAIRAMCRDNGSEWMFADGIRPDLRDVEKAPAGYLTAEAARIPGVSVGTRYRNCPDRMT